MKEASLSLQTSHTLRELPPRAPAFSWQRVVSFRIVRVHLGKVFVVWGGAEFWQSAAVAPVWCVGCVRFCKRCASADLSPLISRCRDSFPPRGSLLEILSVFTTRLTKCGGRARFVCGVRSGITPYTSAGHSIVGNDSCVVPLQLNVTCRSVLCYGRRRLIPPLISRLRRQTACSFPPPEGKPFQYSFRTAQQSDERKHIYPPSSVAYGDTFPLKGEGFHWFCKLLYRECFKL